VSGGLKNKREGQILVSRFVALIQKVQKQINLLYPHVYLTTFIFKKVGRQKFAPLAFRRLPYTCLNKISLPHQSLVLRCCRAALILQ